MTLSTVLALLTLFVAAPLNWYVTVRLWGLSRERPRVGILRDRAIVAFALAVIVTVFAVIFMSNDHVPPPIPLEWTKPITRGVVLAMSLLSAGYWLRLYRKSAP